MKNYEAIRTICEENSRRSSTVIDEFLIYYAASRNNLEPKMNQRFAAYSHVTRKLKKEWVNMLKSQYIAHKIFRKDGLIEKYLNHAALQRFSREEMSFLKKQTIQPWRFSFSVITNEPADDFFIMEDVYSGEQYTLFSPGITKLVKEQSAVLWFNLIGYNGACWQSFGPIGAYTSFEPDDIFFFATELRPEIEDEAGIQEDVENNPVPYMMLLSGANYPVTFHKNDQFVQVMSEYDLDAINTRDLRKSFKTEYNDGIYRFTLKGWGDHPHFANAYFDERERAIVLTAMTDRGFRALVAGLNEYGNDFSDEPFIRVNPSMLLTAQDILKKKITLNEYDELFKQEPSVQVQGELDKLNAFMAMVLPDINAGREPDIEAHAKKAGVDVETARELVQSLIDRLDNPGKEID